MASTEERDWDAVATRLGRAAVSEGAPTRWYDEVWSAAERDEIDMPWDRSDPHPSLLAHLAGDGAGRRAVVVGAGRGADAEELAARGWRTTAFDISPAAVRLARHKHPDSSVDYQVADLLHLPENLLAASDLAVEIFTVQSLTPELRQRATAGVRSLLAPGAEALVVQFEHTAAQPGDRPPWLFTRAEMESFAADHVELVSLEATPNPRRTDGPRVWVALLRRRG